MAYAINNHPGLTKRRCHRCRGQKNAEKFAGYRKRKHLFRRKVCCMPKNTEFVPAENYEENKVIIMTVDEYETIRLIDKEGFSQEECGEYMNVARTTVQQIYNNARRKIARALVEGVRLRIEGGDYKLCRGEETFCGCGGCQRHRKKSACQVSAK